MYSYQKHTSDILFVYEYFCVVYINIINMYKNILLYHACMSFTGATLYQSYKVVWNTCAQCWMTLYISKIFTDMHMILLGYGILHTFDEKKVAMFYW